MATGRDGSGRGVAALGLLAGLLAACGTGGGAFDYDRAHRDPFSYPFAMGASGGIGRDGAAGSGTGGQGGGLGATSGPGRDALANEVDAARRSAASEARAARQGAAASREAASHERAEARRADRDAQALEAVRRDLRRLSHETPAPGRSAAQIESDPRAALMRERQLRRSIEFESQRRAATDSRPVSADRPGPFDFEASDRLHRRAIEGLTTRRPAPLGGRSPAGGLPDLGPVELP